MQAGMSDATAGVTPQTANAETPVTPPAAAPAAASSSTTQDNFAERVRAAKSPAETRKLIQELRERPLTPEAVKAKDPTPQEAAALAAKEAQAKEATTEGAEATPAESEATEATGDQPAETTESTETETAETTEAEDEGDGSIKAPTAKRLRLQLPENDQVGRMAAAFLQRNRDWTLEQALDAARTKLGVKPPQNADAASTDPKAPATPTVNIDSVNAQIKQLREDRKKANAELRFEDVSDLSDKLEDLLMQRSSLERQADRQQIEQASTYTRQFEASESKAVELYPLAADPESAFGKRMIEIEDTLKELQDPLFDSPDKPLKIAQMVAAELNIAPRRKGVTTPAKAAATATPPSPKKGIVPSGASRTTAPAANQPNPITQEIQQVKTIADMRNLRKKLGLSY